MQPVLTAAQMREVDRLTSEEYGIPSIVLMENAASAVARVISEKLGGSVKNKQILILCGPGNNGGDGAALARILWTQGARVEALVWGDPRNSKGDAKVNFDALASLKDNVALVSVDSLERLSQYWNDIHSGRKLDAIVDAVFGTGLNRPVEEPYLSFLELAQNYASAVPSVPIFAVDIPSGMNSDGGEPHECPLKADFTVTFTAAKPALVLSPTYRACGEVIPANIGSAPAVVNSIEPRFFVAEKADASAWLKLTGFSSDSYKNKRGHTLVIAGSESYSGAAVLAGNAAMRSGVGLVTVVTPRSSKDATASRILPEVMVRGVAETEGGAVSQNESTKKFVETIIAVRRQPMILDADALNLLSPFSAKRSSDEGYDHALILTPHEGEFLRLLGTEEKAAIKDRVAAVREFATKHNRILVLKGERVLSGAPDGRVVVNPTGNSGLGKAGNGDTLTGILAGFAAQAPKMNTDIFETVVAAVYVAGMAGDIAEQRFGKRVMTASDVRECLTDAFASLSTAE